MRKVNIKNILIVFVLVIMGTGCSSRSPIAQLNYGDEVSISTTDKMKTNKISITNEEVGKMAAEGTLLGASGGFVAGLSCGPLFVICSPLASIAGGVFGVAGGTVYGATQAIDRDSEKQISEKFKNVSESFSIQQALEEDLTETTSNYFVVVPQKADNELDIQIKRMTLQGHGDDGVSLYVKLEARLKYTKNMENKTSKKVSFEYVSPPVSVDNWIYGDEQFYQQIIRSASQVLANRVSMNMLKDTQT